MSGEIPHKHPLLDSIAELEAVKSMPKTSETIVSDIHTKVLALLNTDSPQDDASSAEQILALKKELVSEMSWAVEELGSELYKIGEFDEQTTDRGRELMAGIERINASMEHIPEFKTGVWAV